MRSLGQRCQQTCRGVIPAARAGCAVSSLVHPISLLRLSLLRLLDPNFPGNSLWAREFHPLVRPSEIQNLSMEIGRRQHVAGPMASHNITSRASAARRDGTSCAIQARPRRAVCVDSRTTQPLFRNPTSTRSETDGGSSARGPRPLGSLPPVTHHNQMLIILIIIMISRSCNSNRRCNSNVIALALALATLTTLVTNNDIEISCI